jgi:hypothetical protein
MSSLFEDRADSREQPIPMTEESQSVLQRLNTVLDERVLPYPVKFLTNRIVILATLALLIPLIFFTRDQAFVNVLNSYLNVMSVVVSSTVLLYAMIADVRDRAAAKRTEEITRAYERVLEERVQADHDLIQQILQNSLENVLGGRLEKIRIEDHNQLEKIQRAVIASNEALRAELAEKAIIASNESLHAELAALRDLVQALYQSHFGVPPAS